MAGRGSGGGGRLPPPNTTLADLRALLVVAGICVLALAVIILAWPSPFESSKTESTLQAGAGHPTVTTTTTSPSDALIGGVAGAGLLLLLAGVFFDRITSLKALGIEVGMEALHPQTEQKLQKALGVRLRGERPEEIVSRTADAYRIAAERSVEARFVPHGFVMTRRGAAATGEIRTAEPRVLGDDEIEAIVDQVAG